MPNSYPTDVKTAVVAQVQSGKSVATVSADWSVPKCTVRKWGSKAQNGQLFCRHGPQPRLPDAAERHLYDWIVGRQLVRPPVDRAFILKKASEISLLVAGTSVGEGWYSRFMGRHPQLSTRIAQTLPPKRNCVTGGDMATLFDTLAKLVIELQLDGSRIFNMNETAFQTRKKSKRVVAVRGSTKVWCLDPAVNFHLSIVACGSAAGAAVTTSPSGFINMYLFQEWLKFFAKAVPELVKRPLLLVLDGCRLHYSEEVIATAASLDILLVLLPPNAIHLLQPLDVAVFSMLKVKLCNLIKEVVEEDDDGCYSIDKKTAIKLASMAWRSSKIGRNVKPGFRACGLFPVSLVNMNRRLGNYARNGAPKHVHLATWLQMQDTIETDVLTLRSPSKNDRKRKRVSVSGKLLTHDLLRELFKRSSYVIQSASSPSRTSPCCR
ncbi:hypothetical protein PR001_g18756 [Phytophthora rubi]|uniref:HTH CENPB-type domain-containing protein n=1 Tax=Phytophthora rubi TaxID=129364 RepID=A0A6A3K8W0_9STRA|nr:hypothetical protein PR001_g18756 [Phytophthora rubi]